MLTQRVADDKPSPSGPNRREIVAKPRRAGLRAYPKSLIYAMDRSDVPALGDRLTVGQRTLTPPV